VPDIEQDNSLLRELSEQYPEDEVTIMELMPAWKRWGYEEGREEGREEGIEAGKEEERQLIIRKLLNKGLKPEEIADTLDLPLAVVQKQSKS